MSKLEEATSEEEASMFKSRYSADRDASGPALVVALLTGESSEPSPHLLYATIAI